MSKLEELRAECLECRRCKLCETRTNVVFGTGNEHADVMFIGEGPGENEDLQGEPFVGRGGKLLDDMLELIYLDRSQVYIANMVKCRPPKNRDPLPEEQSACAEWLSRQLELIDPKLIVCLGRIAAMRFIRSDFKISREHGQWFDVNGRRVMALYHPAALLRDPHKRPETFEDLKRIRAAIDAL
ncbi:MAG TPA: uracil-DNA glycosylase [Candidatus Scatomorpha gallistercoris]|nr:uracil-DNA glycosylase [Candidatus Scatomorpha gallistercoris]